MKTPLKYVVLLGFCLLFLAGCGAGKYKLGGKITFEDGSPLTDGIVVFQNGGFESRGTIQKDGTYVVGSLSENDGIPPGDYKVYIVNANENKGMGANAMPILVPLIHSKFANPNTSGLTFKVDGSKKDFDIIVTKPQR